MITVEATGPLALLQDLGRPNCAHLGVSPSGAADRRALRLGNRLVGNPETAAAIEVTFGGLVVTADHLVWAAVTGAPTQVRLNGHPTASHTTMTLRTGDRLAIDPPPLGLRNYLALRGGIEAEHVLHSVSRDVLSGLGPEPLRAGQQLGVGVPRQELPNADSAPTGPPRTTMTISAGPRLDWFEASAWRQLLDQPWVVTADCDRVAVRLDGPTLPRRRHDELPSEGLVRGAIQVPASGQPLIFLADHPVTGGYPVIAVLSDRSCDDAAQLRPGDTLRFQLRTPSA